MNLLVLNYEYPPLGGGAGEITKNISENLSALGHKVTIITTWYKGLAEDEKINHVRIIRLKSKRKAFSPSNVFEMRSWIRKSKSFMQEFCNKEKFDVCFANFALPGGEVAFFLKKKFNIPYTIISHGHDIPWLFKKEMFFYHLFTFIRIRRICRNAEFDFVQTKEMKDNINRFLSGKFPEKNIIIQNGIDRTVFYPDVSKRTEKIRILFSGRLVKQKDPFSFLKAIKEVFEKGETDFDAIIAGDGPLRKKMEKYILENRMQDKVKFSGWIKREELLSEYQKANIFIQSSRYEAMSMAVMEALACGAFVVCTVAGSNSSVIKENYNGYFFESGNYLMLAEKIMSALKKFDSDKLQIAAADTITSWEKIAAEYETYFNKVLSGKPSL